MSPEIDWPSLVAAKDAAIRNILDLRYGEDPGEAERLGKVALALTPAGMGEELARLREVEKVPHEGVLASVAELIALRARVAELESGTSTLGFNTGFSSEEWRALRDKSESRAERLADALRTIRTATDRTVTPDAVEELREVVHDLANNALADSPSK